MDARCWATHAVMLLPQTAGQNAPEKQYVHLHLWRATGVVGSERRLNWSSRLRDCSRWASDTGLLRCAILLLGGAGVARGKIPDCAALHPGYEASLA